MGMGARCSQSHSAEGSKPARLPCRCCLLLWALEADRDLFSCFWSSLSWLVVSWPCCNPSPLPVRHRDVNHHSAFMWETLPRAQRWRSWDYWTWMKNVPNSEGLVILQHRWWRLENLELTLPSFVIFYGNATWAFFCQSHSSAMRCPEPGPYQHQPSAVSYTSGWLNSNAPNIQQKNRLSCPSSAAPMFTAAVWVSLSSWSRCIREAECIKPLLALWPLPLQRNHSGLWFLSFHLHLNCC